MVSTLALQLKDIKFDSWLSSKWRSPFTLGMYVVSTCGAVMGLLGRWPGTLERSNSANANVSSFDHKSI